MSQPRKEQVRDWLDRRQAEHTPPPTPEQIREQLGWRLIQAERKEQEKNNAAASGYAYY